MWFGFSWLTRQTLNSGRRRRGGGGGGEEPTSLKSLPLNSVCAEMQQIAEGERDKQGLLPNEMIILSS